MNSSPMQHARVLDLSFVMENTVSSPEGNIDDGATRINILINSKWYSGELSNSGISK